MSDLTIIAKRIKEARIKLDLSQKALGLAAGVDEFSASARINQYERGKHIPDLFMATKIASALEIPLPYLYSEDDLLAEFILAFTQLNHTEQIKLLCDVKQQIKK